ncbi:1,2-phenylacetyl-CoA epoxidase subunit PaaD [Euzebya sp.]|uniref:1,2-phenylacetyl-CoA epoxidase subunit PaaD n=1 Tax=Euzebya sp. TaxID=1971409 RepID=UPI003511D556
MVGAELVDVVDAVRDAVSAVPDPEMPVVTIGHLGMVVDVQVRDGVAEIEVMPTFTGCPATAYIGHDVEAAATAVEGVRAATVRWRRDLSWGPERITAEGREALAESGIAPPGSGQTLLSIGGVRCPWCGSRNTRADSPFGAAPCRSTHTCRDCKTPFDAIKPI